MHRNTARIVLTRLAARITRARVQARCTAPSAGMGCEAMTRALRAPWQGGYVALARAVGVERIEAGRPSQIGATCIAPASDEVAALELAA